VPSKRSVRPWASRALPLQLFYPETEAPRLSPVVFLPGQTSRLHLPAPLRSPGITRLLPAIGRIATMGALTPVRGRACGLLSLAPSPCDRPHRSLHFTYITFRALRLQPPRRSTRSLWHLSCQRHGLPARHGSGLRQSIGGSPDGKAESSSSSYGLPVRLPLLSTPPRGDAVTVGYRTETGIPQGDFHLSDVVRLWTHDGRNTPGHDGETRAYVSGHREHA
jgi:hypothetical protein